ncbi:MAG: hypothetical protein U9Q73_00985 [Nanoarchaeota archaeon]|nr:hypothetical protein [Nanoarchaeota archaeon]
MITTIQLSEQTKNSLNEIKLERETYESLIIRMMQLLEIKKRQQEELLIEGYKEMAEESLKIAKEFEVIEEDFDWRG